MSNDRYVNMAGYTDTFNDGLDSYSLNAGLNSGGGLTSQRQINAYYSHRSPLANLSANIASLQKGYTSFGVSASGGATITGKVRRYMQGECPVEHVFLLTRMVWEVYRLMAGRW